MEMCVDAMVNISFVLAKQKQPEMALRPLKGLGGLTAIHLSFFWSFSPQMSAIQRMFGQQL